MNNFESIDTYLEHFGVKGMRWGFRSDGRTNYGSRSVSKAKAKSESPKSIARNNRIKAKQPTAAQMKNRREITKKVAIGAAIGVGAAAAGVILGRQGRVTIAQASRMANAKSARLVDDVGSFFAKSAIDKQILKLNVQDILDGLY